MREFIKHSCFSHGKRAIQNAFSKHADLFRVEAVESPDRLDALVRAILDGTRHGCTSQNLVAIVNYLLVFVNLTRRSGATVTVRGRSICGVLYFVSSFAQWER